SHLLVALFQSDREIAELCNASGFPEHVLLTAANCTPDEPASGVDIAVERAKKLATAAGLEAPTALHLLLSLVRETRSAASQGLVAAGLLPEKLANAARDALQAQQVTKDATLEAARHDHPQASRRRDNPG